MKIRADREQNISAKNDKIAEKSLLGSLGTIKYLKLL